MSWRSNTALACLLVAAAPLVTHVKGQSEWTWQHPLPQGNDVHDIWGSGPNDIHAVGWGGTIVHYDGSTWSVIPPVSDANLNAVWGTAADDVFAVGAGGTILHLNGAAWSPMPSGTTEELRGVSGSSPDDVIAVGDQGTIVHYDGTTWSPIPSGTAEDLHGVWVSDPNTAFAVGTSGTVLRYDGAGWSSMAVGTTRTLRCVWGSGPSDVWAAGDFGVIAHYNGSSWWLSEEEPARYFTDIWGSAPDDVYFSGYSTSLNRGFVWQFDGVVFPLLYKIEHYDLHAIWGTDSDNIYTMGTYGALVHYDGSIWSKNLLIGRAALSHGYYPTLTGSGPNDVYAADYAVPAPYKLLHDDGTGWSTVDQTWLEQQNFHSAWANGPNDVWVIGTHCSHYNGTTWEDFSAVPVCTDIWASGPNDAWALAYLGIVTCHYDGDSWTSSSEGPQNGTSIWGSGPNDVFAVCEGGHIWHHNGTSWSEMTSPTLHSLWNVWGTGPNDVFAVGDAGTIVHYDGTEWAPMPSGTTGTLYSVCGSGPDDVFATGYGLGTALHYDGTAWSPFPFPQITDPNDIAVVWCSGPTHVIFAGVHGSIIRYGPRLLNITTVNGQWGQVVSDPAPSLTNPLRYAPGAAVTLTAQPIEGKSFKEWQIFDPNYPGDANHAVIDSNNPITIIMSADREITAVFECGTGTGPMLPVTLAALVLCTALRRRG